MELLIAVATGFVGMLGWGFSDYLSSVSMKQNRMSEEAATFWIYAAATFINGILAVVFKVFFHSSIAFPSLNFKEVLMLIALSFLNFVAYLFFFKGLKRGNLSVISTIFSTYAAGSIIVSSIVFGELIPHSQLIALIVITVGILLVSLTNLTNLKDTKGIVYVLPAVLIFSIFFPLWDNLANKGQSFMLVFSIDAFITAEYFLYAKFKGKKLVYPKKIIKNISLAGVFMLCAAFAVSWGYEHTSLTSIVSVVSSGVPIVSCILSYFLLKERLTKLQYVGLFAIIIGGAALFI